MEKLHVSAYRGHPKILTTFLLKEFYIICIYKTLLARKLSKPEYGRYRQKHVVYIIFILYKTLLARKLSKSEDGRYRPKHVVFFHC